ncbi:MAG TPA: thioesterase domain-containing protein [Ktedonobacteraceae bacterium]|nr:thioesterase domain-containing protein [Ktedonobacteraceae bacterium]
MVAPGNYAKWVRCPKPNPHASLRLFCFPYSGGSASSFYAWEQALPMDIEVCYMQLPGRENRLREPAFTEMGPLVDALEEALAPQFTRPYAFFGHSLGALICFTLARQLRKHGKPGPEHLFVSSHRAPQLPHPHELIHDLPATAFIERLRTYNGTPESVLQNAELMALLLPVIQADFTVFETYSYTEEPPLDCPISAFGGEEDDKVSRVELAHWRTQTRNTFELRMFAGDHFFVHSNKALLLQAISQDLVHALNQLHGQRALTV